VSILSLGQWVGRVPKRWTAQSLALSPVIHEQQRVNAAHAHEAAFIALMLRGEYVETAALRSYRYERFSAVYHPAMTEHHDVVGRAGVQLLMFEFDPALLDGAAAGADFMREMRDLTGSRVAWDLLSLHRDAATNYDDLDFESRALEMIGGLLRLPNVVARDLGSVRQAREFVHAHFRDRMTMREIGAAAGVHPVYIGQMFRRHVGETIAAYAARLRVRAAAEELSAAQKPLAQIAVDYGFCDQSHFQRVFKRLTGATPASFRARFSDA
jgi:AraC family transcriptional regulator